VALTALICLIGSGQNSEKSWRRIRGDIIAAKNEDPGALARETADLLYHLIVLLVERGLSLEQVTDELAARRKQSANDDR